MSCSRCCGLMVADNLMDFDGTSGHMWACALRCMNCGHLHDPVIEQNRRRMQASRLAPVLVAVGDDADYHDDEVHLGIESIVAQAA
ncbi:MAG: hypothetical protein IT389_14590 [Nitrospira sp.]|nr:hypothetical protein [Nitrospira sp.]